MLSLGLVMIVRNEEKNLMRSLAPSIKEFDEAVVVDTGSTDQTKSMARQLGAKVCDFVWQDDFSLARNFSIEQAKSDWLLWLDADNGLQAGDVNMIRGLLRPEPAIIWALEKVTRTGELLWQKRIFPNRPEARFQGRVHEQLIHPPLWPQIKSPLLIEHWGYQDPEVLKQKGIYYLSLLRETLQKDPADYYARFQAARCHFNLREFEQAREQLKLAAAEKRLASENSALALHVELMLATTMQRLNETENAFNLLMELTTRYPHEALAFFSAGQLAYTLGDMSKVADLLEKSLSLDLGAPMINLNPLQTRFSAFYLRGLALLKIGRELAGLASLEQALALMPDHRGLRLDLALAQKQAGMDDQARANLEYVREKFPRDARAERLAQKWNENA